MEYILDKIEVGDRVAVLNMLLGYPLDPIETAVVISAGEWGVTVQFEGTGSWVFYSKKDLIKIC